MNGAPSLDSRLTFLQAFALAAAMAMIATALEFAATGYVVARTNHIILQGADLVWAKPLANLLLIVPVALLLRAFWERLFLAGLVFPLIAGPLLVYRPGSRLVMLILAAGAATQLGVLLRRERIRRGVLRTGAVLAGLYVLAAIAIGTRLRSAERPPAEQVAAADGAPNVLLIILDTVRGASLAAFGGRALTPHIDSVAGQGITFERAVSAASWTLPSHASMFTGLWPYEHGADWRTALDDRAPTLAGIFSHHGYRTGGFAANLIYVSRAHGLDRGFQVFRDHRRSPGELLRASALGQVLVTAEVLRRITGYHDVAGRKSASQVNREFLDWSAKNGRQPWFAFLNYYDAHEPYLPNAPYRGRYSAGLPARRFDRLSFTGVEGYISHWETLAPEEVEAEHAAYEESITEMDARLGELFAELQQQGSLDRTLVVIASDHGEQFGEHKLFTHGNSLMWRSIHVPLVIAWPGHLPAGQRVTAPVSLRDLGSTILGLTLPGETAFPGNPFLGPRASAASSSLIMSELSRGDDAAMRTAALQSVAGADWLYVRSAKGREDAYRITSTWSDSAVTDSAVKAAIIDSARTRLAQSGVPDLVRPATARAATGASRN